MPSVRQNSETSGPVEVLLDDHSSAGLGVCQRGGAVGGDDDALARGQAVVLHHVGGAELVQRCRGLVGAGAQPGPRRRDAGGGHHVLGERLAALQPRRRLRRAEAGDPGRADGVGDAGDQRRLRTDDDEVGREFPRERGDRLRVVGGDAALLGDGGGPGVARRADQ